MPPLISVDNAPEVTFAVLSRPVMASSATTYVPS